MGKGWGELSGLGVRRGREGGDGVFRFAECSGWDKRNG